jgi:hypothetical protein
VIRVYNHVVLNTSCCVRVTRTMHISSRFSLTCPYVCSIILSFLLVSRSFLFYFFLFTFLPFFLPLLSSLSSLFPFFFPPNYPFTSRDLPFLPLFLSSSSSFSLLTILILLITQNISLSHLDTHLFNLELTCTSHKTQCTPCSDLQICNSAHLKPIQQ